MKSLAAKTAVIVSTAGPFDIIGMPVILVMSFVYIVVVANDIWVTAIQVVEACIASSTHYVDITGEATFVRKVIDQHHDEAVQKKLKVIC